MVTVIPSKAGRPALSSPRQRVARLWRQPVFRSGYLLVGSSMVSAVLGVPFWLLAARLYSPEVVGLNSAAISAMMLLAGVAQLNLMSMLLRFVPASGRGARRMITSAYLVAAVLGAVSAVVFLAGLSVWARGLVPFLTSPALAVSFVLATTGWAIYSMQSAALVAVGQTGAATGFNQLFNLAKLVLLVVCAVIVPATGVWFSWVAAMVIALVTGVGFLFVHSIPAFIRAHPQAFPLPPRAELARYVGPDYIASLAWIAATSLVPVLALNVTGPAHAAVFALAWQMCMVMYGVPIAFGQALVAHSVREPSRLAGYHRRFLFYSLGLLTPLVLIVVAFAPVLLKPFGSWYVMQGADTVRLLALSTLPNAVVTLTVSRARATRQMRTVVVATVGLAVIVLGLTVVLLPLMGIVGGGVAWLVGQLVVAAEIGRRALSGTLVRSFRAGVPAGARRRALRSAAASGWRRGQTLRTVSATLVMFVSGAGRLPGVMKVTATDAGATSVWRERDILLQLASTEALGSWREVVPTVTEAVRLQDCSYLIVQRLPGTECRATSVDGRVEPTAALAAIAPLHQHGFTRLRVSDTTMARWVDEPAIRVRRALPERAGLRLAMDDLALWLRNEMGDREVTLGWMHGDFHPGNVLTGEDGAVTGLIDWGQADEHGIPVLDAAFWLLATSTSTSTSGGHLGREVVDRLQRAHCWSPREEALIESVPGGRDLPGPVLLLLSWLHHVDTNLSKSDRYGSSRIWMDRAVTPVLRQGLTVLCSPAPVSTPSSPG